MNLARTFDLPGIEWPKFRVSGSLIVVSFKDDDGTIRDFTLTFDAAYELLSSIKALMREPNSRASLKASRMLLEGIRIGVGQYGRHAR